MPATPKKAPDRPARARRGSPEDQERLRRHFIDAAEALFAENGLGAVTMRAVAARAGVSPMAPYRYFADKAELLSGLWETVLRSLCAEMREAIGRQRGGRARQRASLEAFIDYWERHPDHYRLVYMTPQTTQADGEAGLTRASVYGEILEVVRGVTQDLADEIGAPMTHAKIAGDVRFAMLLGYLQAVLVNRRYPWAARQALREAMLSQIMASVERCLLQGAEPPVPPLRRRARAGS